MYRRFKSRRTTFLFAFFFSLARFVPRGLQDFFHDRRKPEVQMRLGHYVGVDSTPSHQRNGPTSLGDSEPPSRDYDDHWNRCISEKKSKGRRIIFRRRRRRNKTALHAHNKPEPESSQMLFSPNMFIFFPASESLYILLINDTIG